MTGFFNNNISQAIVLPKASVNACFLFFVEITLLHRIVVSSSVMECHFNRAFKSVFGSAPGEFVETLRINEAKRRLSVPKRTLDTIAASVGFSDAQTFRRAFERRLGAKPRSYLKNVNAASAAILDSEIKTS